MNENDLGILIRLLRLNNRYTQSELADKLYVSNDTISKWELGKARPNRESEDRICQEFNLSHDDILHPEIAIARLMGENTTEEKEPANISGKRFQKRKKWIVILSIILLIAIVAVILLWYMRKPSDSFSFYYYDSRYYYDTNFEEEVFERSCVYFGKYTADTIDSMLDYLRVEWLQDESIRKDVKVLKLSFYKDVKDAAAWAPTKKWVYLFNE